MCPNCIDLLKLLIKLLQAFSKIKTQMSSYSKSAEFSAFIMTNLINDLLDEAKLDNDVFQLDNQYFNIC